MSKRARSNSTAAAEAKQLIGAKLGVIWWAILFRGILALAFAMCAFVWPEQTLGLLIKLLGVYFLIDGVIGAISAYRSGDKLSPMIQAIVSLSIGLVLLLWTAVSGKVFLILVGVWLLLQGIGLTFAAFRIESGDIQRKLTMVIGGAMALIGVVFVFWTDTSVVAISWLIGIGVSLIGCLLIFLALQVRRLQRLIQSSEPPA